MYACRNSWQNITPHPPDPCINCGLPSLNYVSFFTRIIAHVTQDTGVLHMPKNAQICRFSFHSTLLQQHQD